MSKNKDMSWGVTGNSLVSYWDMQKKYFYYALVLPLSVSICRNCMS